MDLPVNASPEQIKVLEEYLRQQKKSEAAKEYGSKNHYQDKKELMGKKLIIFKHSQKKSGVWYMRFYVGDRKYKILSLRTTEESVAISAALEKWRNLQNQMDLGGEVFVPTTQESIDQYLTYLDSLVEIGQMQKKTVQAKRTSIKKLRLALESYHKPTDIPSNVFDDYVIWRRTKNWDKTKHKRNPNPPSDLTVNKELNDFKGFFDWANKKRLFAKEVQYPFLKIDWNKSIEKNPAFEIDDWLNIVYYLRTWIKKDKNSKGNERKNLFYRKVFAEFFKVLGNSGLRPHEALKLKWGDIQLKSKLEVYKNEKRERIIAHINVSPETKTGRRLVICPAGIYFKRLRDLYRHEESKSPSRDQFIFRNIGTIHSRADQFVGNALSDSFLRRLWYELVEEIEFDKGVVFNHDYTLYSCRSFFINQRLEMGVPPALVAELVGHSIKTMERHYKNIRLKNLEPELVQVVRKKLDDGDFQTFDLD